jgi:hypothetical protein
MSFTFRPAERTAAKPLICFYSESGCGKTMSALLLARGLAGPNGKIAMLDTERGRGQLYADVIPGGYSVAEIEPPFSPATYVAALHAAESEADVVIIDSASHEWEGIGGVLDMAHAIEERTKKPGLHCWKEPKMAHQQFVLALMQSPATVIICCRAKYKSRQGKNPKSGRTEIIKDDRTSPIQAEEFIYEMTVHAEIQQDHTLRVSKSNHPQLAEIFSNGTMVSVETGEKLADWATGAAKPPTGTHEKPQDEPDLSEGARNAAANGTDALRTYWDGLTKPDKKTLQLDLDGLKLDASTADLERGIGA